MSAKFSIKQILSDHWDDFTLQYHNKIRTCVISEVRRVLGCGEIDNGFTFYQCPHCGKYRFVPFRCHSRFCNSCGVAYQRSRSESISSKLINCRHRHIVFTIAEELRIYFRRDRRLLDILFKSAAQTISDWLYEMNHSRNFTSGMVCALHTFGRDLKWNPHIHMIVTEGALDCNGIWKHIAFFPYIMLRKRWMTTLLSNMKHSLDPDIFDIHDFKALVNRLYIEKDNGFYVHAPGTDLASTDAIVNYVTRYIGRPVMAQSRITDYDGSFVSYWYQSHEDNKVHDVREHAFEFIKKLIIHIPEKGFHMLRYYGLYVKGPDSHKQLIRRQSSALSELKRALLKWRYLVESSFNKDPLECECGQTMELVGIFPRSRSHAPPFMVKLP